jgi:hypothetical protein
MADPQEFRRYRQALLIVYLLVGTVAAGLIISSVAAELFFRRSRQSPPPSPAGLLQCNLHVEELLLNLGTKAADLMKGAVTTQEMDLGGKWEEFSKEWQARWKSVNDECQFDKLADTGLGPGYDRMAWVHRNLRATLLNYRELMKRFNDSQADEIAEMRRALDRSRALLDKQATTPKPAQ